MQCVYEIGFKIYLVMRLEVQDISKDFDKKNM